jgi:hypothetical protein
VPGATSVTTSVGTTRHALHLHPARIGLEWLRILLPALEEHAAVREVERHAKTPQDLAADDAGDIGSRERTTARVGCVRGGRVYQREGPELKRLDPPDLEIELAADACRRTRERPRRQDPRRGEQVVLPDERRREQKRVGVRLVDQEAPVDGPAAPDDDAGRDDGLAALETLSSASSAAPAGGWNSAGSVSVSVLSSVDRHDESLHQRKSDDPSIAVPTTWRSRPAAAMKSAGGQGCRRSRSSSQDGQRASCVVSRPACAVLVSLSSSARLRPRGRARAPAAVSS